jgi:hypothetical protein
LVTKDRQFVSWLRNLESDGHEIVIHGYFHERHGGANETLRDKFVTRFYTHNEGEFYDLDYKEALRRITNARDEFRGSGLSPRGFVAPAWLLSSEGERPRATPIWNTRRDCARCTIFVREKSFPAGR